MRVWTAWPPSFTRCVIHRQWSSSSGPFKPLTKFQDLNSRGETALGPSPLNQDEPILADFLAADHVSSYGHVSTSSSPANDSDQAVDSKGQVDTPATSGAISKIPRERRLVAAALQGATALHQVPPPGATAERVRINPVDLRLRPMAYQDLLTKQAQENVKKSPQEDTIPPMKSQAKQIPSTASGSSSGSLRQLRDKVQAPKELKKSICRVLLSDFIAAQEAPEGTLAMPRPDFESALRFANRGEIVQLAQFFGEFELRKAVSAKSNDLPTSDSTSASPPKDARPIRQRLILGASSEQAVVGLFLEGNLSWHRVRALLRSIENPQRSPGVKTQVTPQKRSEVVSEKIKVDE